MSRSSAFAASSRSPSRPRRQPDPRVLGLVRQVSLAGLALVLVWPAARGYSEWLGWLPLWLLGMPLAAWWTLRGFALPCWPRRRVQARRTRRGAVPRGTRTGTA